MAHRIRLGPPWEVAATDDGRTRHLRRFGRPRTIDSNEQVWLVADSLPPGTEASVNGSAIGTEGSSAIVEITHLLAARNEMILIVPRAVPLGEIALEIRSKS